MNAGKNTYHFECVGRGGSNKRDPPPPPPPPPPPLVGDVHDVEKLLNKQSLASSDER